MTRTGLITEVLKRMGRYTQLDTTLQANLIQSFNTVREEFPYLHDWFVIQAPIQEITVVAGTRNYALATGLANIISVRDATNQRMLTAADIQEIEKGQLQVGTSPLRYARWGDDIYIDPYPAAGSTGLPKLNVRYTLLIASPTDGDTTLTVYTGKNIPEKFFELLVRGIMYYGYKLLEMEQEAALARMEYIGPYPDGPLGGYAAFLVAGENRWKLTAWDAQMQPRLR